MSPESSRFRRSGYPCYHKPLAKCNDRLSSRSPEVKLVIIRLSREVKRIRLPAALCETRTTRHNRNERSVGSNKSLYTVLNNR